MHKKSFSMVDLTPKDRMTRKRNYLLQRQLEYQLQILNDELRMKKNDLSENNRDVTDFLMSLYHKAPDLATYGPPDTRAMDDKNGAAERRNSCDGSVFSDKEKLMSKDLTENVQKHRPNSKSAPRRSLSQGRQISLSETSPKRIPGKSYIIRRPNGLETYQKYLSEQNSEYDAASLPPTPKTDYDMRHSVASSKHKVSKLFSKRSNKPKYGREAETDFDEIMRSSILKQFSTIFDPTIEKPKGKISSNSSVSFASSSIRPFSDKTSSGYSQITPGINQRVIWSAPSRRFDLPSYEVVSVKAEEYSRQSSPSHTNQSIKSLCNFQSVPTSVYDRTMQKALMNFTGYRPKTSPSSYDLLHRSMEAPKKQVAGILAEIQSRRSDTRAILSKSEEIKQLVRDMVPDDLLQEEELSD